MTSQHFIIHTDQIKMREEYGLTQEDGFLLVHLVNQFLLETDGGTGWTGIGATERSKEMRFYKT